MKRTLSLLLSLAMTVTLLPQTQLIDINADDNTPYCISQGRPVYVSSGKDGENMVDGNLNTRWESSYGEGVSNTQWMYIDLGKEANIDHMYLKWEAAYAKSYKIQFSNDEENWTDVYTKGNAAEENPDEETTTSYTGISINYKTVPGVTNKAGEPAIQAEWTSVDNATYKVCLDSEDNVAKAPDGYAFNSHGPSQGQICASEGTHKLIVIALDKQGNEVGRGEREVTFTKEEIIETESVSEGETETQVDNTNVTVDFSKLSASEKKARYVRVYMTEKAMPAYGYSLYEVQVYGTDGVVKRPVNYGENIAQGKKVECSGIVDEWWMYDEDGNLKENSVKEMQAENAVDGDSSTSFTSAYKDNQWITVDLGKKYDIGRVAIDWTTNGGKIYDIQVSDDNENWKTIFRRTDGYALMKENQQLYAEGVRYVRVYGYTRVESGNGFGISELKVYPYEEGQPKTNPEIKELPVTQILNNPSGEGSYVTGQMYNEKNKLPTYIDDSLKAPVDSNSWWTSAIVTKYSNLLCIMPFKAKYSTKGLGVLTATSGWVGERGINDLGTDQNCETGIDFYVSPENFDSSSGYDKVMGYGDYSVDIGLWDDDGMQMKSMFTKGSPYIYSDFCENTVAYLSSSSITEVFDKDGNSILTKAGENITTDHIGFISVDSENKKANNDGSYYCLSVPEGTTFQAKVTGSNYKIKITFPSAKDNYMSIAAMKNKSQLEEYYQHGYAFITDTDVKYTYDDTNSKIYTQYIATTELKRKGFENTTMHCLLPHQWKHSSDADNPVSVYRSIRGNMKGIWANSFSTTQQFAGLLPTFATPDSDKFDSAECIEYLHVLEAATSNLNPVSDAYWEGKNVHPLAVGLLMADQLGETELKTIFQKRLKKIMVDWFTYDGGDDRCYFIYNQDWGTIYYPDSAYGANAAICDHHFTYGYFMFGAAVLATYDKEFMNNYKYMIEMLVRDYANPMEPEDDPDGNMFCKFRAFDQYAGHSWAGGYADSDSGNNQESASEALFSWVGMYLWGEATQNDTYIDAGAYGFTTEMDAVEQYWFDYDDTNWLGDDPENDGGYDYPFQAAGQIYGASMGYGTYFGGQPTYVFGIQWLPISEYLTNYGMDQEKCAVIYKGLEDDTQYAIDIETRLAAAKGETYDPNSYVTPDNGWQHITWPFLSQTDATRAYNKFEANAAQVQNTDRANTLWFITAMDQLGYRTNDYVVTGNITGSVYYNKNTDKYTAEVWNPTETSQKVTIIDANGKKVGTANVGTKALVSFEIEKDKNFELNQVSTPTMKATSLAEGVVTENISGEAKFNDTQMVEIECADKDATIYYTTDGTVPTKDSKVYTGKILVSTDTVVKALAVKDGFIDSAYGAVAITIDGDKVESSENLALGKTATASSESGEKAANAVDGISTSRWQAQDSTDDQWIQVDLGSVKSVNTVAIDWEGAYAQKYQIQVSTDGENWDTVANVSGKVAKITTQFAAVKARYVRMQGVQRGTQYAYSIFEFEVYGAVKANAPTITPVSGIYEGKQTVKLETTVKGAEIKYTLDGTTPTEDSATYMGTFDVDKSTIVKAITYRKGMVLSDVAVSNIVIAGTISLSDTQARIATDGTKQLSTLTDEAVTWSSDREDVAKVDSNGLVSGVGVGTANIVATTASGKSAVCKVTVTEPIHITSVELSKTKMDMKNKTSETLEVKILPEDTTDDTTVVWTSDDENILTVNEVGTVTAKKEGTAKVTAKVGKFTVTCEITVGPAATLAEMITSKDYNLALNKHASVSSIYKGEGSQDTGVLTDGNLADSYISTDWANRESDYIILDLEKNYNTAGVDTIAMQFKNDAGTFCNDYEIEYSTNGVEYKKVAEANGVEYENEGLVSIKVGDASDIIDTVRYVKIVLKGHKNWGYQIREAAVLSTDLNAKEVEVETCADPASVNVTSENLSEITYEITPGENQDGFKYLVFVDGEKVAEQTSGGKYTLKNVSAGEHTVMVMSYYDGKLSKGISQTVTVDDGSLKDYVDTDRNLSRGCQVTIDSIYDKEGNQDPATITDGKISGNNDAFVETLWGTKEATVTMDLGKSYDSSMIQEVLLAFKDNNTFANNYTVQFSSNGEDYETVYTAEKISFSKVFENPVDMSAYSQETVRYVKVNLAGDNYGYGYHIYEIAVMGTDAYMPVEAANIKVVSTAKGKINVSFEDGAQNQTYNLYIDGVLKGTNMKAGSYDYAIVTAGTHEVKITANAYGIESKGITTNVDVEVETGAENPSETTSSGKAQPTEVFGQVILKQDGKSVSFTWQQNDEQAKLGQMYKIYYDGVLDRTYIAPATVNHVFKSAGKHVIKITGYLNKIETTGVELEVEIEEESVIETTTKKTSETEAVETTEKVSETEVVETTEKVSETEAVETTTKKADETEAVETTKKADETESIETTKNQDVTKNDSSTTKNDSTKQTTAKADVTTVTGDNQQTTTAKVAIGAVKITKKKPLVKKIKLIVKKVTNATGYEFKYSTNKKFKKKLTKTKLNSKNVILLKKLKSKKKYFIKVRAYTTVNGKKIYGKWSKRISVKSK